MTGVPHAPLRISAVEAHVGSPCRVVLGLPGSLTVPGFSMFEKKCFIEENHDWLRRLMLREPRGGPLQCLDIVLPPTDPEADFGVVIMEQARYYPPMSGGNMFCVVTAVLETGTVAMVEPETTLRVETPAGLVAVSAQCRDGRVLSVSIRNVPSFVYRLDVQVEVEELGTVTLDVAYGGMFYLLVGAEQFGLRLEPQDGSRLASLGERIKVAAQQQLSVAHPENPGIDKIESLLWHGPPKDAENDGRNAVIVSTGAIDAQRPETWRSSIDRSPCGTGTSARLAVLHARGELGVGEPFRHESILDLVWTGRVEEEITVGDLPGIVPSIQGRAWISAHTDFVLAQDDPFPEGFTVTDIWAPEEK
jgi:proline racemase